MPPGGAVPPGPAPETAPAPRLTSASRRTFCPRGTRSGVSRDQGPGLFESELLEKRSRGGAT